MNEGDGKDDREMDGKEDRKMGDKKIGGRKTGK